jgi:hypothetical protein
MRVRHAREAQRCSRARRRGEQELTRRADERYLRRLSSVSRLLRALVQSVDISFKMRLVSTGMSDLVVRGSEWRGNILFLSLHCALPLLLSGQQDVEIQQGLVSVYSTPTILRNSTNRDRHESPKQGGKDVPGSLETPSSPSLSLPLPPFAFFARPRLPSRGVAARYPARRQTTTPGMGRSAAWYDPHVPMQPCRCTLLASTCGETGTQSIGIATHARQNAPYLAPKQVWAASAPNVFMDCRCCSDGWGGADVLHAGAMAARCIISRAWSQNPERKCRLEKQHANPRRQISDKSTWPATTLGLARTRTTIDRRMVNTLVPVESGTAQRRRGKDQYLASLCDYLGVFKLLK